MRRRRLVLGLAGGALVLAAPLAGQPYPARTIRLVVGYPPGAQSDSIARLIGRQLGQLLAIAVVIDNRPGANGTIGAEHVARAAADGHTLLLAGSGNLAIAPLMDRNVGYDALRDFVPIARIARVPALIAVRSDLPIGSIRELIGHARQNPGKLSFASVGASAQLALESLRLQVGLEILFLPYKGAAPAALDVAAGRVDFLLADVSALAPYVQSGQIRVIAGAGARRARLSRSADDDRAGIH